MFYASRNTGPESGYRVEVNEVRTVSGGVLFKGTITKLIASTQKCCFSVHLPENQEPLALGDCSRVINGHRKLVSQKVLNYMTYEEGNDKFLFLGKTKIRLP